MIRAITFRHFPNGFTILNAEGGWFDPQQKKFIEEESRQILICGASRRALSPWCRALARALQQKEFLIIEIGSAKIFRLSIQR